MSGEYAEASVLSKENWRSATLRLTPHMRVATSAAAMSHGPEHHIEHAEHAAHAAHNPFDKKVTLSIAIIAALLACVTMLSHRAHNATLRLQAEANRIQTEGARLQTLANIDHTQASDQWAFYQAKNIRKYEFDAYQKIVALLPIDPQKEAERTKTNEAWAAQAAIWAKDLQEITQKANEFEHLAKEHEKKSEEVLEKAEHSIHESHLEHARGDRFDIAELGVEIALVLSSLAVLTKRSGFWYVGLICCAAGVVVAAYGMIGYSFS